MKKHFHPQKHFGFYVERQKYVAKIHNNSSIFFYTLNAFVNPHTHSDMFHFSDGSTEMTTTSRMLTHAQKAHPSSHTHINTPHSHEAYITSASLL